jgi:hypothetical protein
MSGAGLSLDLDTNGALPPPARVLLDIEGNGLPLLKTVKWVVQHAGGMEKDLLAILHPHEAKPTIPYQANDCASVHDLRLLQHMSSGSPRFATGSCAGIGVLTAVVDPYCGPVLTDVFRSLAERNGPVF